MWRNAIVVAEWLHEVNGFTNSGMFFGTDEEQYCQRKYDNAMRAAAEFGGGPAWDIREFCDYIRATVGEEKRIVLPVADTEQWPSFFVLVQELQCVTFDMFTRYENEVMDGRWNNDNPSDEELADWLRASAKVDAYNRAVAEICQFNAVLMAASAHC